MKGNLVLFFAEAFKRWGAKSPKYTRIWRTVNLIISAVGSVSLSLAQLEVIFPGTWAKIVIGIITVCGLYGAAMNELTVKTPADLPLTEKLNAEKEVKTRYYDTVADFPHVGAEGLFYKTNAGLEYKWNNGVYNEIKK